MIYFTRGLGIAPGVGDVLAETHILGASTQSFFYITNHRGDTVALVDQSGDVVGTYEYDAWGNVVSHTGQDAYFTFSSKHFDAHAGLYYYGFRWYDPVSKRWTQPDPEGLSEGLDLYRFCGNDPVNGVDEYGSRRAVIVVGDLNNILDIAVLNKWLLESRAAEEANKFRKAGWDVHLFNTANRDQNGECTMSSWRDDIIDAIDKPDTEVLIIYAHGQNPIIDSILCSLYSLATFNPSLIPSFWPPQASTGVKLFKRE